MIPEEKTLVESGNCAIVHLRLVLLFEPGRQAEQIAGFSDYDLVEVADKADAANYHVLTFGQGIGQAVTTDDESVAIPVF